MPQLYNAELVKNLAAHFPLRNESNYGLGTAISCMQATPQLRGLWVAPCDEFGDVPDLSGQGRTLHTVASIGGAPTLGQYGILPYIDFSTAFGPQILQRYPEKGLMNFSNQTIWGWFHFDVESAGNEVSLLSMWDAGNNECAYRLWKDAADQLSYSISVDGTVITTINDGGVNFAPSVWFFMLGRFTAATELKLYVGIPATGLLHHYELVAGVPVSIYNTSTSHFMAGSDEDGFNYDGQMSLFGLANFVDGNGGCFTKFHQSRPLFIM